MKNNLRILGILGMICSILCLFVACSNVNITGELVITPKRTSITVSASFETNEQLADCSPYVNLYTLDDGEEEYSTQKTLSFSNDDRTETDEVTFTGLSEETEYVLKLYVTYNNEAHLVSSQTTVTTPQGSTADDPILISTYGDLLDMANDASAHYALAADIDAEGATMDAMFNSSTNFTGTFDGNGHTISNIVLPSNTYIGLFGYAKNATIENFTLDTVSLASTLATSGRGETYLGAVVGRGENVTIKDVTVRNVDFDITFYSTASVSMGGFVGRLLNSSVENCILEDASINVVRARCKIVIGLFAGYIEGTTNITNSYSIGDITAVTYFSTSTSDYNYVGGFLGASGSRGKVSACFTDASITITEDSSKTSVSTTHELVIGGFLGRNLQGIFNIEDCVAIVDINATSSHSSQAYVAGIVGRVDLTAACSLKKCIYIPKSSGISLNYETPEEDDGTQAAAEDETESAQKIYISPVVASSFDFDYENLFVATDVLSYGDNVSLANTVSYTIFTEGYLDYFSDSMKTIILKYTRGQ